MRSEQEIISDVCSFLQEWKIQDPSTVIFFENAGIDGIEAWDFMEDFGDRFEIDLTGYNPDRFHLADAKLLNWPSLLLSRFFFGRSLPKKKFGVEHLFAVVRAGKWFDP